MTPPGTARRPGLVAALLAVALAVVVGLLGAGPASGTAPTYAYDSITCTYDAPANSRTAHVTAVVVHSPPSKQGAASWGRPASVRDDGVAAEAGGSVLSFGSRAAAREGLPGDLAGAGNRFFRGATSKSQDFQAVELPGGGYRMQFSSPANNPGYSKVYVQEIDRAGQVLREYKNTMGPDGLIETKWVHGGP